MMCTRGRAPAPPSCRCVRVVRRGPREGGRGRGEAPEPRAQKKCRRQEHVHPARCTPWCTRRAAQNCGGGGGGGGVRARARRVGSAGRVQGQPGRGAPWPALRKVSATRRCRENPSQRGPEYEKCYFFRVTLTVRLLDTRPAGGRGPARFPGSVARRSARQSVHRSASPSSSASSCSCRRLPASAATRAGHSFRGGDWSAPPRSTCTAEGRGRRTLARTLSGAAPFSALCASEAPLPSRGRASTRRTTGMVP